MSSKSDFNQMKSPVFGDTREINFDQEDGDELNYYDAQDEV